MQKLILVRGIPGSGKSTYASKLAKEKGYRHIEADMYFEKDGRYKFDKDKITDTHKWCQNKTKEELKKGNTVVVANTFTRLWEIEPYEKIAKELNIKLEVIRMENKFKNIHDVPKDITMIMEKRFEDYKNEKIIKD